MAERLLDVKTKEAAMRIRALGGLLCLLIAVGGCATTPLPGGAGDVKGALQSIELYAGWPEREAGYPTEGRERFFASDKELGVGLMWGFPEPGEYTVKLALRTPAGAVHVQREARIGAKAANWLTGRRFPLPQGEEARGLAGEWKVEVFLDGVPVGQRSFRFDPGGIRLRTEVRVTILTGADDPEIAEGDWMWRHRSAALQSLRAAHVTLGIALRDELARRFPWVDGPQPSPGSGDAALLVRTRLGVSPNPDSDSHLAAEVVHVPTQTTRTFHFRSSAGGGRLSRAKSYGVAAADLALRAGSDPEFIRHLIEVCGAAPE
jgi:hypothetical protein